MFLIEAVAELGEQPAGGRVNAFRVPVRRRETDGERQMAGAWPPVHVQLAGGKQRLAKLPVNDSLLWAGVKAPLGSIGGLPVPGLGVEFGEQGAKPG